MISDQVDPQLVIDSLNQRVATLSRENALLEAYIVQLTNKINQKENDDKDSVP